jgi:hypothetical protein
MKYQFLILSILVLTSGCTTIATANTLQSCLTNPNLQKQESERLQRLATEDQADRQGDINAIDWNKVTPRDIQRRIDVAEIFARGCIVSAKDYGAAATVYQHGDTADHAFQTFLWSKRGVELGDLSQKWWLAAGLDRYLVRIGQKQLFATQFSKPNQEPCWCMEQVEETFSDTKRAEYAKKNLNQALEFLKELNKNTTSCEKIKYCKKSLKPSPAGTVPGFW